MEWRYWIYAHNNKGLALENVSASLKEGLNWVDSTITGMGRGAGNLSTEDLYINIKDASNKSLNSLYLLATNDFGYLKRKYEYGLIYCIVWRQIIVFILALYKLCWQIRV